MKEKLIFKPRARLLLQLGDQLIRNESIAFLELIKNAYDADASSVSVTMEKIDDPENGKIIIEDDGCGMTPDIIRNVWMEPGSDFKEKLLEENKRTPKFGRLPLGEKGIGRFAVHKLGSLIEITTKAKERTEVFISIDWESFEKSKYLEDIGIEILERESVYFKDTTGTKIVIKKLKNEWTRGMVRNIYRSLNSFCTPFGNPQSFEIDFEIDKKDWIKDLLSWEEIKDYSLFQFHSKMKGEKIIKFGYKFTPWPAMTKLSGRNVDENDEYIKKRLKMTDSRGSTIDLGKFKIGPVKFEGYIFDRDARILSLGIQDKRGLKKYLDRNGGVKVFRDGIRVYDYGEEGNDWLNLDIRRVNIPAKRISNNIIIGAVYLDRDKSIDLREKTNREGFIENEAYEELKKALIFSLESVEELRKPDKDKIRTVYGLKSKKEPVVSTIKELKVIVKNKIKEKPIKKEINRLLDRIEGDYEQMKEVLLKSAGAGLTLSVVIHEIEKIISELKKIVESEKASNKTIDLVRHLADLVEGYTIIIKKTEIKKWNLKKLIDQAIFNMEYRFKIHNIELIKDYEKQSEKFEVYCARNLVINSLINVMDNSIWWIEYLKKHPGKIFLTISKNISGYVSVVIADNGPGLTLPAEEIVKPFVSAKPDGMGLGLHIVSEIMNAHKGLLLFHQSDEFNIPEEFRDGAIVALAFKKEKEK
jgi:signal transduction histidine kinase